MSSGGPTSGLVKYEMGQSRSQSEMMLRCHLVDLHEEVPLDAVRSVTTVRSISAVPLLPIHSYPRTAVSVS